MHRSVWLFAAVAAVTSVCLAIPALAGAATFSNSAAITINDGTVDGCGAGPSTGATAAAPYPSPITVSGLGTVTDVNVTLTGLTHTFPDDVDVLLVGPAGQTAILMADTGGSAGVSGVNLTFDDAAAASLPDNSALSTGTYRPTIGGTGAGLGCLMPSAFPAPAPGGPYGSSLSVFNGTDPNGVWNLYVVDDNIQDVGSFSGGWSLDITAQPTAVTVASLRATRVQRGVLVRWRTGTEVDGLGFNVYRQQGDRRVRVNRRLLSQTGGVAGTSYSFTDTAAPRHRTIRYWLQSVDQTGARTWHGPVRVAAN